MAPTARRLEQAEVGKGEARAAVRAGFLIRVFETGSMLLRRERLLASAGLGDRSGLQVTM